jgi:hypothetical protein
MDMAWSASMVVAALALIQVAEVPEMVMAQAAWLVVAGDTVARLAGRR